MRSFVLCAVFVSGWTATTDADSPSTAQVAYAVREDVKIHSGPGVEYYATDILPAHGQVEIFKQEGDWAAVRPPAGSFSWIPADAVTRTSEADVARLTREVKTRVGSQISDARFVAYVTLHQGERVRILDDAGDDVESGWIRIAPPAGEFRWVHINDLTTARPADVQDEAVSVTPYEVVSSQEPDESSDNPQTPSLRESLAKIRQTIKTMTPVPVEELAEDPSSVRLASGVEPIDGVDADKSREIVGGADDLGLLPYRRQHKASATPPSLNGELTRIAADLTGQVGQPAMKWSLSSLRHRTQAVIDVSDTIEIRDQATQLLVRIAQFEDIQRRYRQLERNKVASEQPDRGRSQLAGSMPGSPPQAAQPPAVDLAQYDGHGWLMPVVTQNRRVPRYVLTDNQGNVLQFVTPAPGLNLRRYENQRVGIFGTRGFLPSMKQPHLVAERIVSMNVLR